MSDQQLELFDTRDPTKVCYYCGREATHLCDFVVDRQTGATCDRPMCDQHIGRRAGWSHYLLANPRRGVFDSTDYCPGHAHVPEGHRPPFRPVGGGRTA